MASSDWTHPWHPLGNTQQLKRKIGEKRRGSCPCIWPSSISPGAATPALVVFPNTVSVCGSTPHCHQVSTTLWTPWAGKGKQRKIALICKGVSDPEQSTSVFGLKSLHFYQFLHLLSVNGPYTLWSASCLSGFKAACVSLNWCVAPPGDSAARNTSSPLSGTCFPTLVHSSQRDCISFLLNVI